MTLTHYMQHVNTGRSHAKAAGGLLEALSRKAASAVDAREAQRTLDMSNTL